MPLTKEQLEMRKTGIGASEIAAIAGLSKYDTPLSVYLRKTSEETEQIENEYMYWGNALESVIADRYQLDTKLELIPCETIRHDCLSWMFATPDRIVESNPSKLLQIKTAGIRQSAEWGEPGSDFVPDAYLAQVTWEMAVMKKDVTDIAVLIGGNDYRVYTVKYDKDFADKLIAIGEKFWNYNVKKQIRPDPISVYDMQDYLKQKYRRNSGAIIQVEKDDMIIQAFLKAKSNMVEAEEQYIDWENTMKIRIGNNDGIDWGDGKIMWKCNKDSEKTDWKSVALASGASQELISKYTETKPGSRVFRCSIKGEK